MRPARYFEVSILVTMVLIRGGAGTVLGLVRASSWVWVWVIKVRRWGCVVGKACLNFIEL